MKMEIKKKLVMLMITKDMSLRRLISNLIAVIATIEIPRKEWETLIPTLT